MDNRESLVVDSATGVEVALPIAGPGARSFAFLIDWHIRIVLSIAWYVVAALLHNRGWRIVAPLNPGSAWFVYVVAPPAAIYFLYHSVWEVATCGQTPGKRMTGVRIVSRNGGAPSVGALLARNVFRLVDSFPLAYAVGLVTTMLTRQHVRIGDLAAGTLLIYVHTQPVPIEYMARSAVRGRLAADSAEIVGELLQRWPKLATKARLRLARAVLADSAPATQQDEAGVRAALESLATGDVS